MMLMANQENDIFFGVWGFASRLHNWVTGCQMELDSTQWFSGLRRLWIFLANGADVISQVLLCTQFTVLVTNQLHLSKMCACYQRGFKQNGHFNSQNNSCIIWLPGLNAKNMFVKDNFNSVCFARAHHPGSKPQVAGWPTSFYTHFMCVNSSLQISNWLVCHLSEWLLWQLWSTYD